jgi:nucleoside-diphosphate kinase
MQQTLILLKPDAVERQLVGEILSRFERKGLNITAMRMFRFTPELAKTHYAEHVGKPFYPALEEYIMSGEVVGAVLEGVEAVAVVRRMIGPTDGTDAPAGTIRGDFSLSKQRNLVHASDSPESAQREIGIFFPKV